MPEQQENPNTARVKRIDPAHPIRGKEPLPLVEVPRELALIAAGDTPSHAGEQLRTQASQLARHLRVKQQQIDHREAQLNARIAQLEREVRTSRLWLSEREHLFSERERELGPLISQPPPEIVGLAVAEVSARAELNDCWAELREREAELEAREHRVCAAQMRVADEAESLRVAVERLRSDRANFEHQFSVAEQQLARRDAEFNESQQRLLANLARHRLALDQRETRLDQQRRELGIRSQEEVAVASTLLDEQAQRLHEERGEFETQRDNWQAELQHQQESFEARKRETEQNLAELRDKLTARQIAIGQRRESLDQMKQQVFELHRESIEMRMVAEQLWQRVAKGKPVAELTQSLGILRAKLVDEFRVSQDELTVKEQQLRELAGKLNHRQQQLKQQRTELNQWLERRNASIEEQAARLVARELELDTQQRTIRDREAEWRDERRALENRLRQLAKQSRPHSAAAA